MNCGGADGCTGGWVVATRSGINVFTTIGDALKGLQTLGIDMPIGLPAAPGRRSDSAARAYLGPRRSSVFSTPPRSIVDASTHSIANEQSRVTWGTGVSVQAFNLFAKIREVDRCVRDLAAHERTTRLVEIHPECSFRAMTGDVLPSKHTPDGRRRRVEAIEERFGSLGATPRGAAMDDVLDAYAVLWSTERFVRGEHLSFPEGMLEFDEFGLPMRIVV